MAGGRKPDGGDLHFGFVTKMAPRSPRSIQAQIVAAPAGGGAAECCPPTENICRRGREDVANVNAAGERPAESRPAALTPAWPKAVVCGALVGVASH